MENGTFIDYYEFLMISPTADRQMVEWAARLMLARYDPQKSKTPDAKKCELVKEAFRTLADPKKRGAYDGELAKQKPAASVNVNAEITPRDVADARVMRQSIMIILYQAIMRKPRDPDVGRTDLARALGVTPPDLEFSLWFLREKDWITATQAGSYAITILGADWVEAGGVPSLACGEGEPFQQGLGALGRGVLSKQEATAANGQPAALPPATATEHDARGVSSPQIKLAQQKVV